MVTGVLIAACFLIFMLSVEFAKMGWRNIDSIERVVWGREGIVVCALGKSERQYDTFFFFERYQTLILL